MIYYTKNNKFISRIFHLTIFYSALNKVQVNSETILLTSPLWSHDSPLNECSDEGSTHSESWTGAHHYCGPAPVHNCKTNPVQLDSNPRWRSVHCDVGGLHVEMAAFQTIGNRLDSSGWTGALVQANVATPGTGDSFLRVTHMMLNRRAHQITASSLYHLLQKAYLACCSSLGEGT